MEVLLDKKSMDMTSELSMRDITGNDLRDVDVLIKTTILLGENNDKIVY